MTKCIEIHWFHQYYPHFQRPARPPALLTQPPPSFSLLYASYCYFVCVFKAQQETTQCVFYALVKLSRRSRDCNPIVHTPSLPPPRAVPGSGSEVVMTIIGPHGSAPPLRKVKKLLPNTCLSVCLFFFFIFFCVFLLGDKLGLNES